MSYLEDYVEPAIHSHATDELPSDHPRAFDHVSCLRCGELVHASNNETMQTWVELPAGHAFCLACFVIIDGGVAGWTEPE